MARSDKPESDFESIEDIETDLAASIEANQRLNDELSFLFGNEIVEQARQIDIADLNMNKDIIDCISNGIRQLKGLKNNPKSQVDLVNAMEPGEQLVLCLWITDMDLLNKIQNRSYITQ